MVHRNRVGGEQHRFVVKQQLGIPAEGSFLPDTSAAVHDVQDAFLANDRVADDRRDKRDHGNALRAGMRSEDIVDQAVAHVLEGPGYAGGMVVLDAAAGR